MSDETYCTVCATHESHQSQISFRTKYALAIIAFISIVIGTLLELSGFEYIFYLTFYLITIFSAGRWVIPRGLKGASKLHLDINFLMTVAAFGSILINAPFEGAMVIFLFYIAELLEEHASARVKKEVESLFELKPETTTLLIDGNEVNAKVDDVNIGDIIIVRPGERIPLDGEVIEGSSTIDQSTITGESLPIEKTVGDEVFAGTMNQFGFLKIQVTKNPDDTVISRVIKYVEEARSKKAPTEKMVAKFSHIYTPIVVAGAIALTIITFLFGLPIDRAVYRGLTLLVIACPCAFAISIPVTMVSAITGFIRNGILVKGSSYIEFLNDASIVAFDKTGTVTNGNLVFKEILISESVSKDEVLSVLYSIELLSEHPIAEAIIEAAEKWSVEEKKVSEFQSIPGKGIIGIIDGVNYAIGNDKLMEEQGVKINESLEFFKLKGTLLYIARNGIHVATAVLADSIRSSSKPVISGLNQIGVKTVMLTGDNEAIAKEIGTELGLSEIHYELLPEDKVRIIEEISNDSEGRVIMVGDGVNDAPALAASDVGVAMAAISSDVAMETADIALMDSDLTKIIGLIEESKHAIKVVKQNVAAAIGIKVLLGLFALPGLVPLWMAVAIGDMGVSFAVIANALRLAV